MSDEEKQLRSVIEQITDLPVLPTVASHALSMIDDPQTSAEDLGELFRQDLSLSAKVLKLANSAFYGYSRRISTVSEAVVILGFDTLTNLILSASVFEVFPGNGATNIDQEKLWKHSIASGVAGKLAGRRAGYPDHEEALCAGILHELGKLVLEQYFPDETKRILERARSRECSMLEAEREVLGVGHPAIGRWLAENWNLPPKLSTSIGYYHNPLDAPEENRTLAVLTHVGHMLAKTKNIGWNGDYQLPQPDPEIWQTIGLDREQIKRILEDLTPRMQEARAFLQLSVKMAS